MALNVGDEIEILDVFGNQFLTGVLSMQSDRQTVIPYHEYATGVAYYIAQTPHLFEWVHFVNKIKTGETFLVVPPHHVVNVSKIFFSRELQKENRAATELKDLAIEALKSRKPHLDLPEFSYQVHLDDGVPARWALVETRGGPHINYQDIFGVNERM